MKTLSIEEDLTEAEALLHKAFQSGEALNLVGHRPDGKTSASPNGAKRIIRASILCRLLLSDCPVESGALRQLNLTNAIIRGKTDLRYARIDYPIRFTNCVFNHPVLLTEASLRSASMDGCLVPGIDARHLSVDGDLDIQGAIVFGPLQLAGAHLADDLHLDGTYIATPRGGPALDLDNIDVKGKVDANHMLICGAVRTDSACVAGTLRMKDTLIDVTWPGVGRPAPNGSGVAAWHGDGMIVHGEVDASGLRANGTISLVAARVLDLLLRGASIRSTGPALVMDRLDAGGTVCCDEGGSFTGGIRAVGIHVGSTMCLRRAVMTAASGQGLAAVDLRHAEIAEDLLCKPGFSVTGRVALAGARISGKVSFDGADLRPLNDGDNRILNADHAEITENLSADSLSAAGLISLASTEIKGSLTLKQREDGRAAATIDASGLSVSHDVTLDTAGTVKLCGAEITGDTTLSLSRLNAHDHDPAADLAFINTGVLTLRGRPERGCVDLTHARIHLLCDNPRDFPEGTPAILDGFEYDKIAGLGEEPGQNWKQQKSILAERLEWLKAGTHQVRDPNGGYSQVGFVPQPYQQLAAVYEDAGMDRENRAVLHAMYQQRNKVKTARSLSKLWNNLQDWTVGYGYAPRRALGWLLGLAVAAAGIFSAVDHSHLSLAKTLFLPVGLLLPGTSYKDLAPWDTDLGIWSHLLAAGLIMFGLILGATVLAALARRIRR